MYYIYIHTYILTFTNSPVSSAIDASRFNGSMQKLGHATGAVAKNLTQTHIDTYTDNIYICMRMFV